MAVAVARARASLTHLGAADGPARDGDLEHNLLAGGARADDLDVRHLN